jgi:hypothetical protein
MSVSAEDCLLERRHCEKGYLQPLTFAVYLDSFPTYP